MTENVNESIMKLDLVFQQQMLNLSFAVRPLIICCLWVVWYYHALMDLPQHLYAWTERLEQSVLDNLSC